MTDRKVGESNRELRAVAEELGVTDRQLRRWRDQGLLPKPIRRRSMGRAVGSETFYPSRTCEQLRAAVRWFTYDRRVEQVKWALWCDGFDVQMDWEKLLFKELAYARAAAKTQQAIFDQETGHHPVVALETARGLLPGYRRLERGGHEGDFVAFVAGLTKARAEGHHSLPPARAQEIGSMMRAAIPSRLVQGLPGDPRKEMSDAELGRLVNVVLQLADFSALEEHMRANPHVLSEVRDQAVAIFRLWRPDRAGAEPPPPLLFGFLLICSRFEYPVAKVAVSVLQHEELRNFAVQMLNYVVYH